MKPSPTVAPRFPAVRDLLPHEPPLVLLDEVVDRDGDRMVCALTVRADAPFVEPAGVQVVVTLEYMAQTVAAWAGLEGRERGVPVQIGFLIGCREMHLHRSRVAIGTRLTVTSQRVWGDSALGSFQCEVVDVQGHVSTALLTVAQVAVDQLPPEMQPSAPEPAGTP